jgi:hypothetical protein
MAVARLRHTFAGGRHAMAMVAIAIFCLASCSVPSLKDYGDNAIRGGTVDLMKKRHGADPRIWEKQSYALPNGNAVYIEPDSAGCAYHWEANPQGRIVGYRLVGRGCCKHASVRDQLFCDQSQFEDPRLMKANPENGKSN